MEKERDDVRVEPRRAMLARGRYVPERERPDREPRGERRDRELDPAPGWVEPDREAVEQVREEDEQLDVDSLGQHLEESMRVRRHEASDRRDQRDRSDAEDEPEGGLVAEATPPSIGEHGKQDQEGRVRDADSDDQRFQVPP